MRGKFFFAILLIFTATGAGFFGSFLFDAFAGEEPVQVQLESSEPQPGHWAAISELAPSEFREAFVEASAQARPAVVFVKVQSQAQQTNPWDWGFWRYFGNTESVSSFGSGVIISPDGYIVTNQHVVRNAQQIEVVLNNQRRTYSATVVGEDPSTDLAVLKIDGQKLPYLNWGNSDAVQIGEWVLAVGNPFNLTSTVTAGIVGAKGRNINIVQNQFPIESFIQTDAAINPGNSGGALVSLQGELVGVNTAILSETGSYAGYGFAIPANIAAKVVADLIDYGIVQRAFLEAEVVDIDQRLAEQIGAVGVEGVYVRHIYPNGAAERAGLQEGDVIVEMDGRPVHMHSTFDELLAYHRPGDEVTLLVKRNDEVKRVEVELTNSQGTTDLIKNMKVSSKLLGAAFSPLTKVERNKLGLQQGIRISDIRSGLVQRMGLQEGFIITAFNNTIYRSAEELVDAFERARGRVVIEGIDSRGRRGAYSFYIR